MNEQRNITALVWQHAPSQFSGTPLVLLLKLAGLSQKNGHAFAGVERLALMCGVKPRALQYALRELLKAKVVKVQKRKGHSSRYFLETETIGKMPLVIPQEQKAAEPSAEAVKLAVDLEESLRKNLNGVIPQDWKQTWPAELQKLFDAGHLDKDLRPVILFARQSEWWSAELQKSGAHGLVASFPKILASYAKEKKAA